MYFCKTRAFLLVCALVTGVGSNTSLAQQPPRVAVRLTVAPLGNAARYRAQEQLADLDLPSEAVGTTDKISGSIAFDAAGNIVVNSSRITVDVTRLKSDRDRRDEYVQQRLLLTDRYPTVTLVPLSLKGVRFPLPASGTLPVEIVANLTVNGVTRVTTWKGRASFDGRAVSGTVATTITFDQFNLTKPTVMMVLSLENEVALEYDFRLIPAP